MFVVHRVVNGRPKYCVCYGARPFWDSSDVLRQSCIEALAPSKTIYHWVYMYFSVGLRPREGNVSERGLRIL